MFHDLPYSVLWIVLLGPAEGKEIAQEHWYQEMGVIETLLEAAHHK